MKVQDIPQLKLIKINPKQTYYIMDIARIVTVNIFINLFFCFQTINAESIFEHVNSFNKIKQNVHQSFVDTTNKQKLLKKVRESGSIKVWVFYRMHYTPEGNLDGIQKLEQREAIRNMHSRFTDELEERKLHVRSINKMKREPRIAMFVDEEALKYLYRSPNVKKVALVQRYRAHLVESATIVRATESWDLGFTGEREVIVIMDTGVEPDHEILDGKVIDGACFSTDNWEEDISTLCPNGSNQDFGITAGANCTDAHGCDHGTHVAGIAAGTGENLKGVANGADIISIQVFSEIDDIETCPDIDDDGVGDAPCVEAFEDDIQSALDHIFDEFHQNQNYNIAAVSMSLGGGEFSTECDTDPLRQSISTLVNAGISVVASSGNEGYTNAMGSPACIPEVISVGATNNQDEHWEDSNAASFLDLVAPGVGINSSIPGDDYSAFNGTSQAAPHVAGTIALMRGATPSLSVPQIRSILRNSAYWESSMNPNWPHERPSSQYGYGRLDTYESLLEALYLNPNVLLPDNNFIYEDETFEGKDIYILDDHTLRIQGEVTLDKNPTLNDRPSSLNILGTLEGPSSASLNLIDSPLYLLSGGINNFDGDVNIIVQDELTYSENVTIENGFNFIIQTGGTVFLEDGASFSTELGSEFTMEPNTEILLASSSSSLQKIQGGDLVAYSAEDQKENNAKEKDINIPTEFGLNNNYPNPFNPTTVIGYELPRAANVRLEVFDLLGRKIATLVNDQVPSGRHEVRFDASYLSSGIYIYRIRANDFVETRQMTLIK